ncbi:unhealthy ribosome biogenesis protein 2 homolog [Anguilla rostrata]|uniref:unhealthy ribosome biogenesis protein 2 homolog n=1 Tax=Anguilla rostrata TaxID=7938 RepID=UPI0030D54FA2
MAAIYSGIHLKLKSPKTPWTDKLKLARFAWISPQCFLPNKEQVLLDWTSHALTGYYSKKVEFPQQVLEGLWAYLDDILHSKQLQKAISQGKTLSLRSTIAQVVNDRILELGSSPLSASTVLRCCHGILSSPVLSVTYSTRYELLVELLARLCGLACAMPSQEPGDHQRPQVLELLHLALGSYLLVQRQQANPNRVFAQVTTHLLQPLLLLRHLLTAQVHLGREIRARVDAVLQSALFLPDHLLSYREELLPNKEAAASSRGPARKGVLTPVSSILQRLSDPGLCDRSLHFVVRSTSVPLLYRFALDAFCRFGDNKDVCFRLLTRLITALDFTDDLSPKDSFDPANWSPSLLSLENLLNLVLSGDVYNVAADRIQHGEAQFHFYRKVAHLLLYRAQSGVPAWYRCLKALLSLNHLVLEPDLDDLVSSAWVDCDCVEVRSRKAREALIVAVLQTYTKLRQLPRLFQEVLLVVCRPAADELRPPILTAALQRSLSQCLLESPPSQSLEVWRLLLENVQSYLLPDLEGKEDVALKLLSLSGLLHAVLFSIRTLDGSSPLPILKQTQSLMGETLTLITHLLRLLAVKDTEAPWFQTVHQAALFLSYTWVEVDTVFEMHCIRYRSGLAETGPSLLPGVGGEEWEQVLSLSQHCGPLSQFLQEHLTLQRMKKALLKTSICTDADIRGDLCRDAQLIVGAGKVSFHEVSVWDRQVSSVDDRTYPVAHWFLVTSNLGLMAPYLSGDDMSHITDILLDSLLHGGAPDGPEKEAAHLSVAHISKHLLESTMLVELSSLYSVILRCLSKRIVGVLCGSEQGSQCQALLSFCEEVQVTKGEEEEEAGSEGGGSHSEAQSAWSKLGIRAQAVLQSAKAGAKVPLTGTQLESLAGLLQVTRTLNPDGMSPEDHSECFLLLFFMAVSVQPQCDAEPSGIIGLLTEIYRLMTSLQSGSNVGTVLKVVHGSELLETCLSSVFSLSDCLVHTVDSSAWMAFVQAFQSFLQCLLQVIINRRKSLRLNLEKFTTFVVEGEVAVSMLSGPEREGSPEAGSLVSLQLLLASLTTLCQTMTANLGESSKLDETLVQLSERALCTLGPVVQLCLRGQACERLGQAFSVDVVTVMVQVELSQISSRASDGDKQSEQGHLAHRDLYRSFAQQVLKELCSAPRPMDFLFSSLHFLTAYYTAATATAEPNLMDLYISALQNLRMLLAAPWLSVVELQELQTPVKELLTQLVSRSSQEQQHVLMGTLKEGLSSALVRNGRSKDVLSAVTLTKLLASCSLSESCYKAFWFLAPQIISAIIFVVQECARDVALVGELAVPAVEALTVLLRRGEGVLSNPHHVGLAFGALQLVPLELPSAEVYHSAFQAVHEALFAVVQCHPQVMLKATPSFLNCFSRLVASVMREGRQRPEGERGSEAESEVVLKCALLVERMYTHIASVAEGFTVLSSFIVAQYVSELQKVTLYPEIKSHLTEGIYKILDLCVEQDIKFLSSTLPLGVREVFSELYSSYTHYHKTQRQGEAKYTA